MEQAVQHCTGDIHAPVTHLVILPGRQVTHLVTHLTHASVSHLVELQILGHSGSHCVSASHLPLYVFTTSSMVRHVAFRFKRSSQASHQPYSPFALRQQPEFCPQYPKCDLGDQYRNLLNIWHSWQYQLYQCGLHSVHGQSASRLCAPR